MTSTYFFPQQSILPELCSTRDMVHYKVFQHNNMRSHMLWCSSDSRSQNSLASDQNLLQFWPLLDTTVLLRMRFSPTVFHILLLEEALYDSVGKQIFSLCSLYWENELNRYQTCSADFSRFLQGGNHIYILTYLTLWAPTESFSWENGTKRRLPCDW